MAQGLAKLQGLNENVRAGARWCLFWADYYDVPVTVTSGFRSWEQQQKLYNDYLEGRSKYPANPPGESAHNVGLAWDSVVPDWAQGWWNDVRRAAGFYVPANDVIHAAVPDWRRYV